MKIQLLEPDSFPAGALARLSRMGSVIEGPDGDTQEVEAVFTRLAFVLDEAFHARYPRLRWIVSPTTGLDHIACDHFAASNVTIISLRGRTEFLDNIRATAEHTLALCLSLLRKLPRAATEVAAGQWDRNRYKGRELHGKTVLIYGYGRIGRQVAELYGAFGCEVRAHDSVAGRVPPALACDLDDILPRADILSVHLPLAPATSGLIDADLLSRLTPHAILVNTARGDVVDQEALLAALEGGRLAGAALDVLSGEPAPLTPSLLDRLARLGDRLVVTPHIGGFTFESLELVEDFVTDLFVQSVDEAA